MPIFHDPHESPPRRPLPSNSSSVDPQRTWKPLQGYEWTRLDGLPSGFPADYSVDYDMESTVSSHARKLPLLNRVDLMERIKVGKSPSWPQTHNDGNHDDSVESRPMSRDRSKTPQLSPTLARKSRASTPDPLRDHASAGMEIERPRSALHSGDFREKKEDAQPDRRHTPSAPLATSPVAPWHQSFPAAARPPSRTDSSYPFREALTYEPPSAVRARAISQSSLSSFVFMPPTSPLVQQSNNADIDPSSRPGSRQTSKSPERNNRRHTFSPRSFQDFKSVEVARSASGTPAARFGRRGTATPYQAHQPRRSLTSLNQFQPNSNPQTPFLGSRRPSITSDTSPLHHAPMVGSYEESILRGRMSTTPSRPLDFIAKIGVLGKGHCKSNLKCPPHVAVPFPAVFYSYSTGSGPISNDSPSPYVGLIDLENSLSPPEASSEASKRKRRHTVPNPDQDDVEFRHEHDEQDARDKSTENIRRREKRKRRSTSPKAPPGGSYRIPQQGQLQIVIKNPNKTAVKLFLVPYDLSDMEPGQKTFIRQRSYSAGPIIDMPLSSRKNLGTDRPEAALSNSDDPNERPILRIRVVFANRVPDGKEKLRNEIQLPEPRYSTYKPTRDSVAFQAPSTAAVQLTAEKAFRRRSAGLSLSHKAHDPINDFSLRHHPPLPPPAIQFTGGPAQSPDFRLPISTLGPIPFSLIRIPSMPSCPVSREAMDTDMNSPIRPPVDRHVPRLQDTYSPHSANRTLTSFEKLNKGDVGYGGNAFCSHDDPAASSGAGLLSKRLRGLDVQRGDEAKEEEDVGMM